jgi:hypothetical protein
MARKDQKRRKKKLQDSTSYRPQLPTEGSKPILISNKTQDSITVRFQLPTEQSRRFSLPTGIIQRKLIIRAELATNERGQEVVERTDVIEVLPKEHVILSEVLESSSSKVAQKLMASVVRFIKEHDEKDLIQLNEALCDQNIDQDKIDDEDNAEPLWSLELTNLHLLYQRRQKLLEGSITSTQVAELLGCKHRKTVHDYRKANEIIGLKDRGIYKFPLWQFSPEGENGILDGLPLVLSALDISDFRKLSWLNKPLRSFSTLTPIEVLKTGKPADIEDLIIEAEGVGVAQ